MWARDDERLQGGSWALPSVSLPSASARIGPDRRRRDRRCAMPHAEPAATARGLSLIEPPKKGRAAWVVRLRCDALQS